MQLIISPGYTTPIEDRVTTPEEPGSGYSSLDRGGLDYAYWFLGMSEQWQEQHLGPNTAFSFSPYWACINAITHSMCSVGWHQFERDGEKSNQVAPEDPVSWALDMQANEEMSAIDWREVMLKDALDCGNGYSEIVRDGYQRMQGMYHLGAARVRPDRTAGGKLIYEVENGTGIKNDILLPAEIFHLKGIGGDGLVGWSIREFAKRSIKLGIDEEGYGSSFFSRGLAPSGVLKFQTKQSPEQLREYKKEFDTKYGGKKNQHGVIALGGPMDFTPWTVNNREAEMTDARILQGLEMCRFFRVPPHKIFDLSRATFNNIEEQNIEFVTDCLLYWAMKLEAEANIKLYGRTNRGKRYTRLNLAALLRGDLMSQTEALTKQIAMGVLLPDEARKFWDRNPYPHELGTKPVIQGAMISLDKAVNPPAIPGAALADEDDDLIDLPDYRQTASYDCGCACVHSVADFFKVGGGRTEQDYIRELGTTQTDGTEPEAIIDWLNDAGLFCMSGSGMTIEDLETACDQGFPVIVPVQMYGVTQEYDAEEIDNQTGHYVAVIGVGMGQVFFQDPSAGRQMLPATDFEKIWHDVEADGVVDDHFGIVVSDEIPISEPEPPPAPPAPKPQPTQQNKPPEQVAAAFERLIADAYERLLNNHINHAERLKGKRDWLPKYIEGFCAENQVHFKKVMEPLYNAFAVAARVPPLNGLMEDRAQAYDDKVRGCLDSRGADALKKLDRVALARDDIAFIWSSHANST